MPNGVQRCFDNEICKYKDLAAAAAITASWRSHSSPPLGPPVASPSPAVCRAAGHFLGILAAEQKPQWHDMAFPSTPQGI